MVLERHVKVLESAHRTGVSVNLKHEREHFHYIVLDKSFHCHVVDLSFLLVLEEKLARERSEELIVADGQVVAFDPHYSVDAWRDDVHVGVDLCSTCHLTVQQSLWWYCYWRHFSTYR